MLRHLVRRLFGTEAESDQEGNESAVITELDGQIIIDRFDLRYRPADQEGGWNSLLKDVDPEEARRALRERRLEGDLAPGTYACFPISVATADSPPRFGSARWTITVEQETEEDEGLGLSPEVVKEIDATVARAVEMRNRSADVEGLFE